MRRDTRIPAALVLLALAAASTALAQEARHPLTLDDHGRLRGVSDPRVSPDGRWIAYTVSTIDVEKDKRDSDLWMASWDGTQQVRLTATTDSSESRPRWSPDGRYLAFLASRGDEEQKKKGAQVWLLDRLGGEAQQLTDVKGGVSEYDWSPDSIRLVLAVNDFDPTSDPEKMDGWKRKTKPPIVIDRYHFKSDADGYRTRLYTHLALFDVASKKVETLTSGQFDDEHPAWSPDGKTIAFVSKRGVDPDRTEDTNIFVVEAMAGAQVKQLTAFAGPDEGQPSWSPDGRLIAFAEGDEDRYSAYQLLKLAVVPAAGGPTKVLTAALDRQVQAPFVWSADGRSIRAVVEDDRAAQVVKVTVETGATEMLTKSRQVVDGLSARADGTLALLSATADAPAEVHVLENGALRRVTHQNDALLKTIQLAATEDFTCKAKDGTVVNGLVIKPYGFTAGKKYPTLLHIHGGPNGQDDHEFSFERQFFAANGYVVLAVNYRGSSGRGSAYQKAIFADWGNKEVVDLLAAVDWAVASGIADPQRLGIGGWSYGGILTDYTIATDTRFKAAVSGASSALQLTMYGLDQYIVQYEAELGLPWKKPETWMKVSYPFFHADRIKTPTLFLCGQIDFNVPIAGVEQMYQALRSQDIDTRLVIYPDQHHGLTMPSYIRDRLQRYVEWWDKYLKK
jgi:dipeptidyl aminopeptidase/acylaminoacyl peptidase